MLICVCEGCFFFSTVSSLFSFGDGHQMIRLWQDRESNNNFNAMLLHQGCALVHKRLFETRERKGADSAQSIFLRLKGTKFFNSLL